MSALRAMPPADVRILVVDDDHDLREAVCDVLGDAGYRVDGAGNGAEALRFLAAADPLPDLILLDVMMPIMDGYRFRQAQLADPQLAAVPTIALSAGPLDERIQHLQFTAWMAKPVSVVALLSAVERHRLRRASDGPAETAPAAHSVQFYDSDGSLAADVARFLAPAVTAGTAALVIATADHWQAIESQLAAIGCEPAEARGRGALRVLDAGELLDTFLQQDRIDQRRFAEVVGGALAGAERLSPRVRAYGEMVDLLWQGGDIAAAVSLEQSWNRLLATARCDLHCAYAAPVTAAQRAAVDWIRQQHAASTAV